MTLTRPGSEPASSSASLRSATSAGLPIEWMRVQSGLWVGRTRGEFAGMIESRGPQFAAIRLSKLIGTFDSLSEAKRSFN